ncbi:histidine kinase [Mesorhizobium sp. NBSH29]|uniref:Hpt domain-containing protein n=1 Tax=Mesorhizobium sp. NBSH29 TaxID=2654249 RepID=UPI0018969593|nr:Hpt domain-containing protein [Mesorhizobium sp. NBSH29]QPC87954.1 histidine kinase [Mesorhizobium sp. NBSH29]
MATLDKIAPVLDKPGGESCGAARVRPIDMHHLAHQTMGDRALEQEVLTLFVSQALSVRDRILQASRDERFKLAHALKGSARSIGAGAVAECASSIEADPGNKAALNRLGALIDEVRDFVAAINR